MKKTIFILLLLALLISCKDNKRVKNTTIQDEIINNRNSFFYINFANYPVNNKTLPIGIFDSGTGGLTVLDAIINSDNFINNSHKPSDKGDNKIDFENESFIYLGDKANMPYGEYAGNNKTKLLKEHVIKDVQFLLDNKYYKNQKSKNYLSDKPKVKAIVIACNTATAYGKSDVEKFVKQAGLNLKVIGVIGAGVRGALETINNNENAAIGIMATAGTVASNGYPNTVNEQKEKFNYTGRITTFQQAGIGLAAAIDGEKDYLDNTLTNTRDSYRGPSLTRKDALINSSILKRYNFDFSNNRILYKGKRNNPKVIQLNSIDNYIKYHVISLLEKLRKSNSPDKLTSVILGCTHYPFYTENFRKVFNYAFNYKENGQYVYRKYMNPNIKLIDPAINTAKELYVYLNSKDLFNNSSLSNSQFYISVPNLDNPNIQLRDSLNFTHDYKYGRTEGEFQQYVKRVPFSENNLSPHLLTRLEKQIPLTYGLIENFINKMKEE